MRYKCALHCHWLQAGVSFGAGCVCDLGLFRSQEVEPPPPSWFPPFFRSSCFPIFVCTALTSRSAETLPNSAGAAFRVQSLQRHWLGMKSLNFIRVLLAMGETGLHSSCRLLPESRVRVRIACQTNNTITYLAGPRQPWRLARHSPQPPPPASLSSHSHQPMHTRTTMAGSMSFHSLPLLAERQIELNPMSATCSTAKPPAMRNLCGSTPDRRGVAFA